MQIIVQLTKKESTIKKLKKKGLSTMTGYNSESKDQSPQHLHDLPART